MIYSFSAEWYLCVNMLKCCVSVSLYNLHHCTVSVYTVGAKCWFRFLLYLKYVAGAGARTDLLGASRGEPGLRHGFQQIIKFSPHNDTGAITTWTPTLSRDQLVC